MSTIFTGVKVLVTAGKYKGKTARILSHKENTCTLLADGEFTTIQEITGTPYSVGNYIPSGDIKREYVTTLDWKTPPSSCFIRSNDNAFFQSFLKYCDDQSPKINLFTGSDFYHSELRNKIRRAESVLPLWAKIYFLGDRNSEGWLEEWWTLYCAHAVAPAAIKIQAEMRKYLKRKNYLEILSLKPGGIGYLKCKEGFEMMASPC